MCPVLTFELGGRFFAVASYSAMMYLAAAVAISLALVVTTRRGLPLGRVVICLASTAAAVPVGARLLHAAINSPSYVENPGLLIGLDFGRFSLYGGVLLALVAGFLVCRLLHVDVVRLADSAVPALGVGVAIMRVGCFLAGCCFGVETGLPWGVTFPVGSSAHFHQVASGLHIFSGGPSPVHPTQLYELAAALMAAGLAAWLLRRKAADGTAFLAAGAWFSAFRWANYYLRVPPATLSVPDWFYPALYAGIILLCVSLLLRRHPLAFRAPWRPKKRTTAAT